jgi:hypothetical protein
MSLTIASPWSAGEGAAGKRDDGGRLADGIREKQWRSLARRRLLGEQELIQLGETGSPLIDIGQAGHEINQLVDFCLSVHRTPVDVLAKGIGV